MSLIRSLPRTILRTSHFHPTPLASSSSSRHYASRSSFTRPGPPPLPAADQAEFEAQQKAAQTVGATPASTLPPGEISKEVDVDLEKHRDLRRGPVPEFMGERNPKTGEMGGPKVDPFKSGDGDWSYAGRVTVSPQSWSRAIAADDSGLLIWGLPLDTLIYVLAPVSLTLASCRVQASYNNAYPYNRLSLIQSRSLSPKQPETQNHAITLPPHHSPPLLYGDLTISSYFLPSECVTNLAWAAHSPLALPSPSSWPSRQ
jgi:hypothetical protein